MGTKVEFESISPVIPFCERSGGGAAPRPRKGQPLTRTGDTPATPPLRRHRLPFASCGSRLRPGGCAGLRPLPPGVRGNAPALRAGIRRLGRICGCDFRKCDKALSQAKGCPPRGTPPASALFQSVQPGMSPQTGRRLSRRPQPGTQTSIGASADWRGFTPPNHPDSPRGFGVRGSAPPCAGVVESPTQTIPEPTSLQT